MAQRLSNILALRIMPLLLIVTASASVGCGGADEETLEEARGGGGIEYGSGAMCFQYPVGAGSLEDYLDYASMQGFGVWSSWGGGRHLARDVNMSSGDRVYAIGAGTVRVSTSTTFRGYGNRCGGYGYLIVIEHVLADGTHLTSLYGHVRAGPYDEAEETGLIPEGASVRRGQYIGQVADYWADTDGDSVCDDANWDHLHFGIRVGAYDPAERARHVRGYSGGGEDVDYDSSGVARGGAWTDPDTFIEDHDDPETCAPDSDALHLSWRTPNGAAASRITLSGSWSSWQPYREVWNAATITAEVPLSACTGIDLSVEYVQGGSTSWSCTGSGTVNGIMTTTWGESTVVGSPVPNGLGGCNLRTTAPCGGSAPIPAPTPPPVGTNQIACAAAGSQLAITMQGAISTALVGGPLPGGIGFIAVGSEVTGWDTQPYATDYFAVYNGNAYAHTITVPASVDRFNLWVGGPSGTRWFDLATWYATGAGCNVVPDGTGGLVVER